MPNHSDIHHQIETLLHHGLQYSIYQNIIHKEHFHFEELDLIFYDKLKPSVMEHIKTCPLCLEYILGSFADYYELYPELEFKQLRALLKDIQLH